MKQLIVEEKVNESTPVQLVGSKEWHDAFGFGPESEFQKSFSQLHPKKMGPSMTEEETGQIVRTTKKARFAGFIAVLAVITCVFVFNLGYPIMMVVTVVSYFVVSIIVEKYFPSSLRCPLCKADMREKAEMCPSCRSDLKALKW